MRPLSRSAALALAALCVLSSSASASPFGVADRQPFALVDRGTGTKYVGSRCSSSAECFSANCVAVNGTTTKTCQRQPVGGPCFQNNNCETRYCAPQKVCAVDARKAPREQCERDSECQSNSCTERVDFNCYGADGSYDQCEYGPALSFCDGFKLGHTCKISGDCAQGICKNGTCQIGQNGDPCAEPYQCAGLCGADNKCYTPTKGSVRPGLDCKANGECSTGRCTDEQLEQNADGINFVASSPQKPLRCDYFQLGEAGCRTFRDCTDGLCINGTCALAKDGARCQQTHQCQNYCSRAGTCFVPAQTVNQTKGGYCKGVLTGECKRSGVFHYPAFTRPSLDDPSKRIGVYDCVCT